METFGSKLRQAREARGVSLRQVAASTKISISALEGLERNDFSRIPGGIFRRAFIRAYALQVGLEPEATVKEFMTEVERVERDEAAKVTRRPEISAEDREFLERQRRAAFALKIGGAIALVVAVSWGVWQVKSIWQRKSQAAASPAPPGTTARTDVSLPAEPGAKPDSASLPVPALPPASPTGSSTPTPPPDSAAPLAVSLQFIDDCWTKVTADKKVVFEGLMHSGDRRNVTAQRELVLDLGNAGAMTWSLNGKIARPLGSMGETRHIRITPATVGDFVR